MPTYQEFLRDLNSTVERVNDSVAQTYADVNEEQIKHQDKINESIKKTNNAVFEKSTEVTKANAKTQEESAKKQSEILTTTLNAINSSMVKVTEQYRKLLKDYTDRQQKLEFGLIGTSITKTTLDNTIKLLGSNAFIQQQEVYKNLTNLVSSGITMNAAQRAYLKAATDQVGLQFNANSDTLNRLIQIYETDISEARVAQMAGLREFLQTNYKNSQYIFNGFEQVSNALLQMQSMMSVDIAMNTEKTIQGYLGAFTSAGGSNASGLAAAINKIGSGDFNLDQGMQNLLVMAASKAGLSYADILTNGLNANSSDVLLNAMFDYIASMGDSGSNVMMNAMARLFGVDVTDIRAAQNMARNGVSTNYNTDIGNFFSQIEKTTNLSTMLNTWWNNQMGVNAFKSVNSGMGLVGFDLLSGLTDMIGNAVLNAANTPQGLLSSLIDAAGVGSKGMSILGSGIKAIPGLAVLAPILGKAFSNFSLTGLLTHQNEEGGFQGWLEGLLKGALGGAGFDEGTVASIYDQLGGKWTDGSGSWSFSGGYRARSAGTDSSFVASNEEETEKTTVKIEAESEEEGHSFEDLYHLLADDYPTTTFSTVANIPHETNNVVMIGSTETTQYIVDMLTITAVSTENILMLLENAFGGANRTLIDMSALELQNMWGDWSGTSTSNP